MVSDTFEKALLAAQAEGSLNAAWKAFVNTRFYVPIVHAPDLDPKKSKIHTTPGTAAGSEAVLISEVRDRVAHGDAVLWLNGAEIVKMLHAEAGILVALSDRAFAIAHDKVDWLRKGIEQAQARAAAKLQATGATVAAKPAPPAAPVALAKAPAPAPVAAAPAKPAAPMAPVKRPKGGVLDVAALKPRTVEMADLGLSFYVPGAWREERSAKALRFHDPASGLRVEASGFHRPGLQLEQWVGMRVALVETEMRFLTQDGPSYALTGEGWRDRISGRAVEFTGTFPGETVPGRYLVACIHVDGTVVSLAFRATAEVFEQQRALFQWLLSRVELAGQEALAAYRAPASRTGTAQIEMGEYVTPGPVGLSMQGRIGRLRALAYSVPAMLPFVGIAILAAVLFPKSPILGGVMAITGVVLMFWFSVRLMVMRLHDVNLSGKWILGFLVLCGVAGATQKPAMLLGVSALFWLFMLVIYFLVPGTDGDNDYGPPPGPNTPLVQIGAGIFILFQLLGIYGNVKYGGWQGRGLTGASAPAAEHVGAPMATFHSPDNSFVVDLPGVPAELPNSPYLNSQLGNVTLRQFYLEAGGHDYTIQTMDFGAVPQDRYAMMNRAEQAVAGRDGMVGAAKPFLFNNGINGREVRARAPDGSLRVARLVMVGSKLVLVMIGRVDETRDSAQVEQVFKTFQLN